MPNFEAAQALVAQLPEMIATPEETATEETPVETPEAETPVEPEKPKEPEVDHEAQTRLALMQERLAALRERRARERASSKTSSVEEELKKRQAALEAQELEQRTKWENAVKNPETAFDALGLKPEQVIQRLTDRLVNADTPEAKQRAYEESVKELIKNEVGKVTPEVKKALDELQAAKKELAELKARQDQEKKAQEAWEKEQREDIFWDKLQADKFEELHDFYSREKLTDMAYFYGTMLAKAGQPYDFDSIANKILDEHNNWNQNVAKRKAERAKKKTELTKVTPATNEQEVPAAIGNDIVATTASGETRKLSKDDRMKKAARELSGVKLTASIGR